MLALSVCEGNNILQYSTIDWDKPKNAEGVRNLQPRVVRVSALPWVNKRSFHCNPEGVAETFQARALKLFANSFRVHSRKPTPFPRALPWAGTCKRLRR